MRDNHNKKKFFLTAGLLLVTCLLFAPPLPPSTTETPLDLGASIVIGGGLMYGIMKIRKFKKKKDN